MNQERLFVYCSDDFRLTGSMDYIISNVGLNNSFNASDPFAIRIAAKDFDNNGTYDAIASVYLKDKKGVKKEFCFFSRDDMLM